MTNKEEYRKELGQRIKKCRTALGLTQQQVDLACGYPSSNNGRVTRAWETGENAPPLEKLRTVCSVLDTTLGDLLP